MFDTFNMGIGYGLVVPPTATAAIIRHFETHQIAAYPIGEVITGEGLVVGLPER